MKLNKRILISFLLAAGLWLAGGRVLFAADLGTELGAQDDLAVFGTEGTVPDPDVEIKGFSIFGSTNVLTYISTAPGNTVFNGAVQISSDVYVVGRSTFTAPLQVWNPAGFSGDLLYISTGTSNVIRMTGTGEIYANKYYGNGAGLTGVSSTDNTKVLKAGDTMTGQLTLSASTLTVVAPVSSASSLWVSTSASTPHLYVSTSGAVGIGTTGSGAKLDLRGTGDLLRIAYDDGGISKRIDVNATSVSNTLQYVTNDLNFRDSALPRVTFKQGGNVGIGTTTPNTMLTVVQAGVGSSGLGDIARFDRSAAGEPELMIHSLGGAADPWLSMTTDGKFGIATGIADPFNSDIRTNAKFMINTTGNVGIGTVSPQSALHVSGTSPIFMLSASNGGANQKSWGWFAAEDLYLRTHADDGTAGYNVMLFDRGTGTAHDNTRFFTSNAERMRIDSSGRVGIGTDNPGEKLEVNGNFLLPNSGQYLWKNNVGTGRLFAYTSADNTVNFRGLGGASIGDGTTGGFIYQMASGGTILTMTDAGNVGVGTTSPGYKLDVNGDMNLAAGGVYRIGGVAQSGSSKWTAGTGDNIYRNLGAVGIGTASPASPLHVKTGGQTFVQIESEGSGSNNATLQLKAGSQTGEFSLSAPANGTGQAGDLYYWDGTGVRLIIKDTTGNVGIGTASPATILEIGNSPTWVSQLKVKHGTGVGAYFGSARADSSGVEISANRDQDTGIFDDANKTHARIGMSVSDGDSNINFNTASANNINATERMRIDKNGNVGIGTTNPGSRFEVAGGSSTFRGSNSNSAIAGFTDAGGNYRMVVSTAGNVGIGTASPDMNLQIAGGTGIGDEVVGIHIKSLNTNNAAVLELDYPVAGNGKNFRLRSTNLGAKGGLIISNKTDGTDLMTIDKDGNVGIGTTAPATPLQIYGASGDVAQRITSGSTEFELRNTGSENRISAIAAVPLTFRTSNIESMRITSAGNVGIGTASPVTKLDLVGGSFQISSSDAGETNGDRYLRIGAWDTDGVIRINSGPDSTMYFNREIGTPRDFHIWNGQTTSLLSVIGATGNVGIGTASPGYKLDVNGDMNLAAGSVYRINGVAQSGTSKWTAGTGDDIYRNAGSVGIGTTNPLARIAIAKLDVVGVSVADTFAFGAVGGAVPGGSVAITAEIRGGGPGMALRTNALERMTIDNTGSVGIGTASPSNKLHVEGTGGAAAGIYLNNAVPSATSYTLYNNAGTLYWNGSAIGGGGSQTPWTSNINAAGYTLSGNSTASGNLTLDSTSNAAKGYVLLNPSGGSVGIGTTNPTSRIAIAKLDVVGVSVADTFAFGAVGGAVPGGSVAITAEIRGGGPGMALRTNALERMTIDNTGNIGIGTTSPEQLLHIKNTAAAFAGIDVQGGQAGDAGWLLMSGYPSAGDFSIRESGVQTSVTVKKTSGNVGIGTTAPGTKLDIRAAGTLNLMVGNSNAAAIGNISEIILNPSNVTYAVTEAPRIYAYESEASGNYKAELRFDTYQGGGVRGTRMTIDGTGNVGIGTTNPGAMLEVAGQVKVTGGSPGAGKVLTSDAAGLATWQTPGGGSVPAGVIVMWSGTLASIPAGWALCDGSSGTPDLRDRFVYGASQGQNPGATGGAASHSHSVPEAGIRFKYTGTPLAERTPCGESTSFSTWSTSSGETSSGAGGHCDGAEWVYSHDAYTYSGTTGSGDNLPPYYKIAFIMKL